MCLLFIPFLLASSILAGKSELYVKVNELQQHWIDSGHSLELAVFSPEEVAALQSDITHVFGKAKRRVLYIPIKLEPSTKTSVHSNCKIEPYALSGTKPASSKNKYVPSKSAPLLPLFNCVISFQGTQPLVLRDLYPNA
ncbi:hypothetical protein F2Q69_00027363 [Brassica cretica]|uniref:Uncharacterized protein n=1 Tax=Brassica cretica TaxID=69181 RepID=A0A8S9S0T6_BRACR|nr:hypothetical protein F2Q69_00027363 [Brassica cretica]